MHRAIVIFLSMMAMALAEPVTVRGDAKLAEIVLADAVLRIDWLDGEKPASGFRSETKDGRSVTSWQRDGAGITQTVFFSEKDQVTVIHLLADKTGALQFKATFAEAKPSARRGELMADGKRAWVLPFESEVAAEGNAQVVRGEGEAMIIVATGKQATADLLDKLTRKYCGEGENPDFTKLWAGMSK